jgi:deoxycytidylate deaminase
VKSFDDHESIAAPMSRAPRDELMRRAQRRQECATMSNWLVCSRARTQGARLPIAECPASHQSLQHPHGQGAGRLQAEHGAATGDGDDVLAAPALEQRLVSWVEAPTAKRRRRARRQVGRRADSKATAPEREAQLPELVILRWSKKVATKTTSGKHAKVSTQADSVGSELVLGFVGPVGVANSRFHDDAMARLRAFGYHPQLIRLSERLDDLKAEGLIATVLCSEPEFERVRSHMDAGDELRGLEMPGARGLAAAAAVAKIASMRDKNPKGQTKPMLRYAWLISSLKNPAEVEVLRRVYGPGFFLVGLFATEAERKRSLERGMTADQATALIARDAENEDKHGQQTRKTFELADAWVKDEEQLCRFLDLVFGNPFQTPTDDEDGMALAYAAALRSSDLSRQVGAAIVSPTGEVLATGRNEVPAPGGGQYSPPTIEIPTARDCDVGIDSNTKERLRIESEIAELVEKGIRSEFKELEEALDGEPKKKFTEKLAQVRQLVSAMLRKTSLRDITEYGRAVHAEMSALMSAVRIGAPVRDATVYCTTFPCHTCAKHLAAAGIARVVFVEPTRRARQWICIVMQSLSWEKHLTRTRCQSELPSWQGVERDLSPSSALDLVATLIFLPEAWKRSHDQP